MLDYDRALYYTHRSEWDNLLVLMVRTKDQILSKKIERLNTFCMRINFLKTIPLLNVNYTHCCVILIMLTKLRELYLSRKMSLSSQFKENSCSAECPSSYSLGTIRVWLIFTYILSSSTSFATKSRDSSNKVPSS